MVRAVKRGRFVFPGGRDQRKSYGYIEGLLDSFECMMGRPEACLTFNYAEAQTETIGALVAIIQQYLGRRYPVLTMPLPMLVIAACLAQWLTRGRSAIHPARVRKAALSTHIVPLVLTELGFTFRYGFRASLNDWAAKAPGDF
jgi:hypothetical protein